MERTLYAIEELSPGDRWSTLYRQAAIGYRQWFLREGDAARPSYAEAVRALRRHMPELVPTYEALVELAGGGDYAARLLALWRPTPYLTGCSQAIWKGERTLLVRNYDYQPGLWDGVLLASSWTEQRVLGMLDSLWGVLDGVNEAGLAVSLAFGGRPVVGDGFGMPLILRYVLETCDDVPAAVSALTRIPTHMSYNVSVLDARGQHRTLHLAPDRPAAVTRRAVATNHQRVVEWEAFAHATASVDRERYLRAHLEDVTGDPARFIQRFLEPPLHMGTFARGWGTLYTAVYEPRTTSVALHWAGATLHESIAEFHEATVNLTFTGLPREKRHV